MKRISLVFCLFFILLGCHKDKKVRHSLFKKGGEWNIVSLTEEAHTTDTSYTGYTDTYTGGGKITFNKDGKGNFAPTGDIKTFCIDNFTFPSLPCSFTYYNTENQVFLETEDEYGVTFGMEIDGDKLLLTYKETSNDNDYYVNSPTSLDDSYSITITCKRK